MRLPRSQEGVGPYGRKSLNEYRASDLVAKDNEIARGFNAALKYASRIVVRQRFSSISDSDSDWRKNAYGFRLLHRGDRVIPLEDLTPEQQKKAREIMEQRQTIVAEVGEILEAADRSDRRAEAVGSIFPQLADRANRLFSTLENMQALFTVGRVPLPFQVKEFGPFTSQIVPTGGDRKYEHDEESRRRRNGWFTESVAPELCRLLKDQFLKTVLPGFEGIVYSKGRTFMWSNEPRYRGFSVEGRGEPLFPNFYHSISLEKIAEMVERYGSIRVPTGVGGGGGVTSVSFLDLARACIDGTLDWQTLETLKNLQKTDKRSEALTPHNHKQGEPPHGSLIKTFHEYDLLQYFKLDGQCFSVFYNGDPRFKSISHHFPDLQQNGIGPAFVYCFLSKDPLDPKNINTFELYEDLGSTLKMKS